jgi:hypothetical protein
MLIVENNRYELHFSVNFLITHHKELLSMHDDLHIQTVFISKCSKASPFS